MVGGADCTLQVEPLHAAHLPRLQAGESSALLPRLQTLLLQGLIARAESLFPVLPWIRQPRALVALESDQLRALVELRPHNRQGTCWRLAIEDISTPSQHSRAQVLSTLLKESLLGAHPRSRSWVIRCPSQDRDQIEVLRELGFQPLRRTRLWSRASTPSPMPTELGDGCIWSPLNRRSAPLLWPLEQASASSHQRQIVDRRCNDLLDQCGAGSGVLLGKGDNGPIALAGLLRIDRGPDGARCELVRDLAWDERLNRALPAVLDRLQREQPDLKLLCNEEDRPLNALLERAGWNSIGEELLLGRSLWRRQIQPRQRPNSLQLESVLGRLQPQRPPLPTPSLGRR